MNNYISFTSVYNQISNRLINDVELINENNEHMKAKALWDTGATNTCISYDVVSNLKLQSNGTVNNLGVGGTTTSNTYLLNIQLPNNLTVRDVRVMDSAIGQQGIDVLIGMDIIKLGDFAISNYNGQTIFSFRYPSVEITDYTNNLK